MLHYYRRTTHHGEKGKCPLRRVIKRPTQHGAPGNWQEVGKPCSNKFHNVGRERHATRQCATHTFGSPRGARGVEHRATEHLIGRFCVTRTCKKCFELDEVCNLSHSGTSTALNAHNVLHALRTFIFHCFCNRAFITCINQNNFCLGIVEYVGKLVGYPVPVDGNIGPSTVGTSLSNFKPLTLVASHHRNGVAGSEPKITQAVH